MFAVPRPANILQSVMADGGASATFAAQLRSPGLVNLWHMQVLMICRQILMCVAAWL